jgi:hypothetical protein
LKEQMLPAKDEIPCLERRLNETFWVLDIVFVMNPRLAQEVGILRWCSKALANEMAR